MSEDNLPKRIIFRTDIETEMKLTEIAKSKSTTRSKLLRQYLKNGIKKDTRKGDGACYIRETKKNTNT